MNLLRVLNRVQNSVVRSFIGPLIPADAVKPTDSYVEIISVELGPTPILIMSARKLSDKLVSSTDSFIKPVLLVCPNCTSRLCYQLQITVRHYGTQHMPSTLTSQNSYSYPGLIHTHVYLYPIPRSHPHMYCYPNPNPIYLPQLHSLVFIITANRIHVQCIMSYPNQSFWVITRAQVHWSLIKFICVTVITLEQIISLQF